MESEAIVELVADVSNDGVGDVWVCISDGDTVIVAVARTVRCASDLDYTSAL